MAALAILLAALNSTSSNETVAGNTTHSLAFNMPQINSTGTLQYQPGDSVNVSWTSPFEYTTVEVWQGPSDDGVFSMQTIAANFTEDHTSVLWSAGPLDNTSSTDSFHFRLQKGHAPNTCSECFINGPTFQVEGTQSASHTDTSTADSSSTPSPTSSSSSSSISNSTKLAIGLGIGLGVSAAIALVVILWWFLRRQERRMSEEDDADVANRAAATAKREKEKQLRYSSGQDSSATQASYHSSFQFEERPQEGFQAFWHRVFGR